MKSCINLNNLIKKHNSFSHRPYNQTPVFFQSKCSSANWRSVSHHRAVDILLLPHTFQKDTLTHTSLRFLHCQSQQIIKYAKYNHNIMNCSRDECFPCSYTIWWFLTCVMKDIATHFLLPPSITAFNIISEDNNHSLNIINKCYDNKSN